MITKNKIKQEIQIAKWFENHIIRDYQMIFRIGSPRVETLTWGNEGGGSNYRVDYVLRDGALCVYGDLGEAIYQWYGPTSLQWIADLDLGYFHGKCVASENGSMPHDWNSEEAIKTIKDNLRNWLKDGSIDINYYKDTPGAKDTLRKFLGATGNKSELENLCHSGDAKLAFNDDEWWEWVPQCGKELPIGIHAHLFGLKMAFGTIK